MKLPLGVHRNITETQKSSQTNHLILDKKVSIVKVSAV